MPEDKQQHRAFMDYVYGPMSQEELTNLHDSIEKLREETARRANDGDHRYDDLVGPFESIIVDSETVLKERQKRGK
jgi:hypothetical protein